MENLNRLLSGLSPQRKILAGLAGIIGLLAVLGIARMATIPDMALLYGGLGAEGAGAVLTELEQRGVRYDVRGDRIFVPAAERDNLRMSMAAQGLPANLTEGYEILDNLSGFGTTSQMFDAAYWRAKEGELARTILANPRVERARVHIASTSNSPFALSAEASASVSVSVKNGTLRPETAEAFRFLVASAVGGLSSQNVVVIDAATGRVIGRESGDGVTASGAERAAEMKTNVHRLLSARVGAENAVVEVNIEPIARSELIRERTIDPESRVAISTDVEEVTSSEQNAGGAGVTVASNLPDGDAAEGGRESQRQNEETRSVTNYELSETTREIQIAPGGVKRLTVAVLINQDVLDVEAEARDAELARLGDLVSAAVGFDEARGDTVTVQALPFSEPPALGTEAETARPFFYGLPAEQLVQLGVLAAVALILGLLVVRPILRAAREPEQAAPEPLELTTEAGVSPAAMITDVTTPSQAAEEGALSPAEPTQPALLASSDPAGRPDSEIKGLKTTIEARQEDTLAVLKSWLEDDARETA